MARATTSYWDRSPRYLDRGDEELQGMDPVEVALAPYYGNNGDQARSNRIRLLLYKPHDDGPCRRPTQRSPSPPRSKRACIPASINAILDLKEVVPSTTTMEDDHCAICFKALTAGQVVHDDKDDDATADDDDLKALGALLADQEEDDDDEEEEDDDDAADYEQKATVTWLRPLRLRAMPCSHVFHQHCIFKWLTRNAFCPICHHKLPTTDDDE